MIGQLINFTNILDLSGSSLTYGMRNIHLGAVWLVSQRRCFSPKKVENESKYVSPTDSFLAAIYIVGLSTNRILMDIP